jgi:hypothetical protein
VIDYLGRFQGLEVLFQPYQSVGVNLQGDVVIDKLAQISIG